MSSIQDFRVSAFTGSTVKLNATEHYTNYMDQKALRSFRIEFYYSPEW